MRCIEEVRERRRQRILNRGRIAVRIEFEQINIMTGFFMKGSTVPGNRQCSGVHHGPLRVIISASETSGDVAAEEPCVIGCLRPRAQDLLIQFEEQCSAHLHYTILPAQGEVVPPSL